MKNLITENEKTVASILHISTFSKYFFPLGNFLFPILLWVVHKDKPFVNENGRQAINFQLSIFLYSVLIGLLIFPFLFVYVDDFVTLIQKLDNNSINLYNSNITQISGFVFIVIVVAILLLALFVFEIYTVIMASIYASQGKVYNYPLNISFIPKNSTQTNTSKNT